MQLKLCVSCLANTGFLYDHSVASASFMDKSKLTSLMLEEHYFEFIAGTALPV